MSEQVPYGYTPGAAPMPVRPVRPPLTSQQKRGAMIAGGVGFTVMSLGFAILAVVGTVLVVFGILGFVGTLLAQSGGSRDEFLTSVADAVRDYWWVGLIAALLGVAIWVAGYLVSVRILKSSGNPRATAITWASIGIGIVAGWIVGAIISIPANVIATLPANEADAGVIIVASVIAAVVSIASTAAVGVFTWWWMAHALRPAAPVAAGPDAANPSA